MSAHPDPDAVETLVATARAGQEPSAEDFRAVVHVLHGWLARRGLSPEDREEVSSDAVMRLLRAVSDGGLDPQRAPGAWLRVVADHLALDRLRKEKRFSGRALFENAHADAREEERLSAFLERTAAAADVRRAMRDAADAGEHELIRIISSWLALANADGEAPSSRQVGDRLGISHMTVQRALKRFGDSFLA